MYKRQNCKKKICKTYKLYKIASSHLHNVLLHERFNRSANFQAILNRIAVALLPSMCNESCVLMTKKCISGHFLSDHRETTASLISGKLFYPFERVLFHRMLFASESPYLPSSATSRHDAISDVLHHARPIEPSRFPRASLGTMTSRSPELLSQPVLTTMCINNSRTETYVNVSQSTIPFEAS